MCPFASFLPLIRENGRRRSRSFAVTWLVNIRTVVVIIVVFVDRAFCPVNLNAEPDSKYILVEIFSYCIV